MRLTVHLFPTSLLAATFLIPVGAYADPVHLLCTSTYRKGTASLTFDEDKMTAQIDPMNLAPQHSTKTKSGGVFRMGILSH